LEKIVGNVLCDQLKTIVVVCADDLLAIKFKQDVNVVWNRKTAVSNLLAEQFAQSVNPLLKQLLFICVVQSLV
jgi:hypothetical protein